MAVSCQAKTVPLLRPSSLIHPHKLVFNGGDAGFRPRVRIAYSKQSFIAIAFASELTITHLKLNVKQLLILRIYILLNQLISAKYS